MPLHPISWKVRFNIIHSTARSLRWSLPLRFLHQNPLCPYHLILPDLITRIIFGEQYRSKSSSLCSLLHSPVTSSLLGPNTFPSTLFSNQEGTRFGRLDISPFSVDGGRHTQRGLIELSSLKGPVCCCRTDLPVSEYCFLYGTQ